MYNVELANDARDTLTGEATVERIQVWLVSEVAELLSVAPETVDTQELLSNYGLSSIAGMVLSGDVEEWLGLKLDPAVVWEYPTIEMLADYLSQEVGGQVAAR